MLHLTGNNITDDWCIYTLHNLTGELVFIWQSKICNSLNWKDAICNPAFDKNQRYTFQIHGIYKNQRDANKAVTNWLRANSWPELNKTARYNRRTKVQCVETGKIYNSQYDCAKSEGLNQSQLSQHLRRNPGYRSIKGFHYVNIVPNSPTNTITYP